MSLAGELEDLQSLGSPGSWRQRNLKRRRQKPITRSLHTNCILESTLSRIFLFLKKTSHEGFRGCFYNSQSRESCGPRYPPLLKYFRVAACDF